MGFAPFPRAMFSWAAALGKRRFLCLRILDFRGDLRGSLKLVTNEPVVM